MFSIYNVSLCNDFNFDMILFSKSLVYITLTIIDFVFALSGDVR